jgi:phenylacetate-CoA ligase
VLTRILGRARHRVVLPGGERRYAHFGARQFGRVDAIRQFQLVQTTRERVEIRLVLRRPLAPDEVALLTSMVQKGLGYPFEVTIVPVEAIPRTASGKYEDFRSDVP